MVTTSTTIVYGTKWCGDCRRAARVLDQHKWPYQYIDIEHDQAALEYVKQVNKGNQSVPTIVFPDGSVMVEPSSATLAEKLAALKQ